MRSLPSIITQGVLDSAPGYSGRPKAVTDETARDRLLASILASCPPPALYIVCTLIALHPLPWNLGSRTVGGRGDLFIFIWDQWWLRYSLLVQHRSPFRTNHLFHPDGVSLAGHTLNAGDGLLGLLISPSGDLLFAHNMLLIISFALSGYFTFLLVRELTGSSWGALLGGVVFAFAPAKWTAVFHGQMNISSTQWLPLSLFFIVLLIRTPRWRWSMGLGLALAALFYTSFQQCVFFALLAPFVAALARIGRRKEGSIVGVLPFLSTAMALFVFLSAPLLVEMVVHGDQARFGVTLQEAGGMRIGLERLILGQTFPHRWKSFLGGWESAVPGTGPFYGYAFSTILLAGMLTLPFRRQGRLQVLIATVPAALSAWLMSGLEPELFGRAFPSLATYALAFPGFGSIRALYRYAIPLTLSLSLITGYLLRGVTTAGVRGRLRDRFGITAARPLVFLCLALFVLLPYLEYLKVPLRTSSLPAPPAIYAGEDFRNGCGAVLELPYWCSGADFWIGNARYETLWYQTIHRRPMVGGHVSRAGKAALASTVIDNTLRYLALPHPTGEPPPAASVRGTFSRFGIGAVNISKGDYGPGVVQRVVRVLGSALELDTLYEDERFLTLKVGDSPKRYSK